MQGVFQEYWPQNTSGQYYWTVHPWHISVGGAPKREILKKAEIWEGHDETEAESMTKRLNDKGLPSFLACLIFLYPGYCFLCLDIPLFGLPWWLSGKESACQCRRHRFDPWSETISWRSWRKWQPTPVFFLAWRIPGTEESDGLPSMGSHRVGHDCSDLAAAATWRSKCNPL